MPNEHVGLDEGVGVQELLDPLPGGELASLVLLLDGFGAACEPGFALEGGKLLGLRVDPARWVLPGLGYLLGRHVREHSGGAPWPSV